jgi:hypothetical protein
MRVITAITANLVAFSCPNIADANWLARCESADGLLRVVARADLMQETIVL